MQRPMTKVGAKVIMAQSSKSRSHPNLQPVQEDKSGYGPDSDLPEDQWPIVARLSVGGLSQQGRVIREICREAIRIVEVTLVTKQAWPELHQGAVYKRQVLLEAVDALRANKDNDGRQDAGYDGVRTRILEDDRFIRTIGKWVRNFKVSDVLHIYFMSSRLSIGYHIIVES
jgi:hypothetical protein